MELVRKSGWNKANSEELASHAGLMKGLKPGIVNELTVKYISRTEPDTAIGH